MPIRLICLDADDTLWGHESYFQEAARRYEQLLASQVDGEQAMRRLDEIEDRNLHLYGYGVKGFTLSMMETAVEMLGDRLTATHMRQILDIGRDLMRHPIELLPGVREALGPLAERAPLALVTKGDLFHQEVKLAASGLGDRFSSVDIVSEKTPTALSQRVPTPWRAARHGAYGRQFVALRHLARSNRRRLRRPYPARIRVGARTRRRPRRPCALRPPRFACRTAALRGSDQRRRGVIGFPVKPAHEVFCGLDLRVSTPLLALSLAPCPGRSV